MQNTEKYSAVWQLSSHLRAQPIQLLFLTPGSLWALPGGLHVPNFQGIFKGESISEVHFIFHSATKQ